MARLRYGAIKYGDRDMNFRLVREGTAKDIEEMLTKHEIALMVRPTGFGKTYTMIRLCELAKYKKIIYLYPTDIIKQSVIDDYHDSYMVPVESGSDKMKRVAGTEGRKFNLTEAEIKENQDLPTLIFCSYAKMLRDWNNAYKYSEDYYKSDLAAQKELEKNWDNPQTEKDIKRKLKIQKDWLKVRFKDVDLLIIDEAHMVGAEGFMEYWPHIRNMFMGANKLKDSRLHVVGATATPLRTANDVDIEHDIFYYVYNGKHKSARIRDFTIIDCWEAGILPKPYYTKGVLDKNEELKKLSDNITKALAVKNEKGKATSRASKVKVINAYTLGKEEECKREIRALQASFENIPDPAETIRQGVYYVNKEGLETKSYMRFLVFYQDTKDMLKWHDKINDCFRQAFNIGTSSEGAGYPPLNVYYLVSNKELAESKGIKTNKIEEISERTEYLESIDYAKGEIDIIHSIDMLNMGYHVGTVTGVVIKRSTGSEIKYYQQIGRCMSVRSNQTPLIIDFDNADSVLMQRTQDTLRREATERIREFIDGCNQSEYAQLINSIYNRVKMSVSLDELPDKLIEYYYLDRYSPIYFIRGIAKALKCNDGVDAIINKLFDIAYRSSTYSVDDIVDDSYVKTDVRVDQKVKTTLVSQIEKMVNKLREERRQPEDA